MSYTDRVFKAMRDDHEYDAATLASITHIDEKSVQTSLHLLNKGGGS